MGVVLALLLGAALLQAQSNPVGFSPQWIDKSVSPCTDFYRYACGNWIAKNPLPPEYSRYVRFNEVIRRNEAVLQDILETASSKTASLSPIDRQIGDFYGACMDEEGIERLGARPLRAQFDRIKAVQDVRELAAQLALLHRNGVEALFAFYSTPDLKNSTTYIADVDQSGLGLPDRDYYLNNDAETAALLDKYRLHVQKMFELAGDTVARAAAKAKVVLSIETALAKASMDRTSRRDPSNIYHKMSRAGLAKLAPGFDWDRYFEDAGAPPFADVNVDSPEFIKAVNTLLTTHSLDDWKTYLSWHTVHAFAPILPRAFVQENFAFYGKTLSGTKELQPRWRRCVNMVDSYLGEALGRKFVEKTFPPDAKQRMIEMVGAIEAALRKDIHALDWMSADTKKQALAKLEVIANKIGYPEKWIDYSTVAVNRADAFQNVVAGEQFAKKRTLTKIGKRVDPLEWQMTPPTVNAYYSPEENNINFPAGILQPPFFDTRLDRAVNYGAIGSVIGHEITHGFDDSGRRFDAKGNLHDWWTAQDAKAFEERAECFVKQYAGYAAVPGANLNGRLTLGENTADNGGVRIAYMALLDTLTGKAKELIDGYTAEQRFFLGFAQVWCSNSTEQEERLRVKVDPHSPGRFRVNGVVSNMPEFRQAFGCTAGQPMVREQSCRVW